MRERDPGMLVIPDQRRQEAKCESEEEQIKPGPLEFATMPRRQREDEHDRDELKGVRVFGEKPEPDEQAGDEPESMGVRTFLQREPESEHGGDPEKDRKRIDRHHEIADVEERDGVERDHRPEPGALIEQFPREIIEQQARRRAEDWAPKANAEFRGAKNRGTASNHERDSGSLAEIRRREALGPHPVMRFIK